MCLERRMFHVENDRIFVQYHFLHHFVQIHMQTCFGSRRLKVLLFGICVKLYVVMPPVMFLGGKKCIVFLWLAGEVCLFI